ncbi:MAG TPA: ornithine cyclodeaminase family protein [Methylomirabilota bacterium]|nr:ornithine cyclodeaminase family protein [Methylomirabilota bacterium]
MHFVDAERTHALLDYPGLVEALRELYRRGIDRLERMGLSQPLPKGGTNDWLLLPAWQYGRNFGAKLVSIFPGNAAKGKESILGIYALFDGDTGEPLAVIDGAALTVRKTAANSALAATYLARKDAARLLMVGAGAMAPHLIMAHASVRPIREVKVWNRSPERARKVAAELKMNGVRVEAVIDLEAATRWADIVSCATMATSPVIHGAWLKPGTHLDLVGSYRPDMREADDACVTRAKRHYVDARLTTLEESGDIIDPVASGLIDPEALIETFDLARGEKPGRIDEEEITFFKSGGGGHEDLGTAQYLLKRLQSGA